MSGSVKSQYCIFGFLYRYWRGYLKLLKTMNMDEELLTAVLQLCDVELLFDDQHGMCSIDELLHKELKTFKILFEIIVLSGFRPHGIPEWEQITKLKKTQHCIGNSSEKSTLDEIVCIYCNAKVFSKYMYSMVRFLHILFCRLYLFIFH